MHLFKADGAEATALTKTSLAALGLRERDHLQEWVIANPTVLGDGLLVVTSEYDSWRGTDGVASKDRLDILALEPSGRLVVAELKRDEDRDVHLQAVNYAALVSRFDLETLAEAHAKFLAGRGTPTTVDEARERLLEHVEEFDQETLRAPRIVLVAASFPRIVTHTAVWLSEMGLDVSLVQVGAWQAGEQLIGSFERLYPVQAVEEFTLAPARQEAAAAKARAEERSRRGRSLDRLTSAGALPIGTVLSLVPETRVTAEERKEVLDWVSEQSARGQATFNGDPALGLTWYDGSRWSPTGLAKHIVEQATGRKPRVIGGPRWWATPEGVTLRALADSVSDARPGGFDWTRLHHMLERLPEGRWTTYGDLASIVGTHAQPVGQHITNCTVCEHAWRVLDSQGRVAAGFSWSDPGQTDDPADLLQAEGLRLRDGRADPQQRLRRDELAALAPQGHSEPDVSEG